MKSNIPKSIVARPTKDIPQAGCVTAQCHAGVKKFNALHGPVNVNACDACHKLLDASKHKYELARPKNEICVFCHKLDLRGAPVVHKPVTTGDCLQCHSPHGGTDKRSLRGANMTEFCDKCHKDVLAGKKRAHGPAVAGACGACHQAHVSQYPKLLNFKGRDLCLSCHKQMDAQMHKVKFPHKAVEADCLACHDAHASDYPMFTRRPPVALCTEACHEKVRKEVKDDKFKHGVVTQEQGCLNCHTAHGGDLAKLMKTTPLKVCMACHTNKIERPGLAAVPGVGEVLEPKLFKHGPINQGNCSGCHQLHGSDVAKLPIKPYPEGFYEDFTPDKYALCFSCHDAQLATQKLTQGVTKFRNGQTNLHFVHVDKVEKGRSCRACHSTHASKNPMHIRESVPYGQWQMPVRYAPSATGGTCASGCHKELTYDRANPVVYAPSSATSAPATAPSDPNAVKPQENPK
ncbi:MAG: hypothetical protein NTV86_07345 [Planctomycetota bacterium]|nr:hypothetical protein [Planctomycetota bacterium]